MRRTMIVLVMVAAVLLPGTARADDVGRWRGPCDGWWMGESLQPRDWQTRPDVAVARIRRLVVCVFGTWAPGESITALIVADRESSLYPWASNGGAYLGLFQHAAGYWGSRARAYLWHGWFAPHVWVPSAFDARAASIVTAKMVADPSIGWGPWL